MFIEIPFFNLDYSKSQMKQIYRTLLIRKILIYLKIIFIYYFIIDLIKWLLIILIA